MNFNNSEIKDKERANKNVFYNGRIVKFLEKKDIVYKYGANNILYFYIKNYRYAIKFNYEVYNLYKIKLDFESIYKEEPPIYTTNKIKNINYYVINIIVM